MEVENQAIKKTHPIGLRILFMTEMWERFSYYGMRAILILYVSKHLQMSDYESGNLYGAYTGLVYFTPILGGYLADKYLGYFNSILIGGILMTLGHFSLAIETLTNFYVGLGLLILGNGFFKPNISTMLGKLYDRNESLKDSGFTIFYMGINLGGFFGPILCGIAGEKYGWHYGFGIAGVGMILGLTQFVIGRNKLLFNDTKESQSKIENTMEESQESKDKILAIILFAIFSAFFWMSFEQSGSSMNIYADRYVNRFIFGYEIPASIFQSINPLLILILAPFFAKIWTGLAIKNKEPNTPIKFTFAFILLSIGFLLLAIGSVGIEPIQSNKSNMLWLISSYFFMTLGELCISPVGLSMVSKLSPVHLGGIMMGMWFLSNAFAHYISGYLSGIMKNFNSISEYFLLFVLIGIFSTISLYIIRKRLLKLMHLKD